VNIKQLIVGEIERQGMDGLYCSEGPCGCLKEDLAPCGTEDYYGCSIGKRMEWAADESCGCGASGIDHWHICDPNYPKPTDKGVNTHG